MHRIVKQYPPSKSPLVTTHDVDQPAYLRGSSIQGSASFLISMIVHALFIFVLGIMNFAEKPTAALELVVVEPEPEERIRPFEIELDELDKIVKEMTVAKLSVQEMGLQGSKQASVKAPEFDMVPLESLESPIMDIDSDILLTKDTDSLIEDMPLGTIGSVQAVVSDYQEAMDQISQELIWMLSDSPVLVIWLFDQSESMIDDRQLIQKRIHRIYGEVGLSEYARDEALTTAVASFGKGYTLHTRAPTNEQDDIDQAISEVPTDPSGMEMFSSAVIQSIKLHRRYARIARRKIALIVVTDESGNTKDNNQQLESAISIAQATDTRVFVLGREAVFGYPFAHVRWIHPERGSFHLLPVDRGPEAAVVEQLQTDGFGKRTDAMASGFGPFEQVRLARETNGIFFLLPGEEENVNEFIDRRYIPERINLYRPNLKSRVEQVEAIKIDPLKTLVTKIIYDLNPYQQEVADVIEIQQSFSSEFAVFRTQARRQQAKMITYIQYLDKAIDAAEKNRVLRDESTSLRWQANYDLLYGQLLAYRARAYEYGAYLANFLKDPPKMEPQPEYMEFRGWRLRTADELAAPEKTKSDIDLSTDVLKHVMQQHAGTPWATRAAWEIKRGFGVELQPVYVDLRVQMQRRMNRPSSPTMPQTPIQIPKL